MAQQRSEVATYTVQGETLESIAAKLLYDDHEAVLVLLGIDYTLHHGAIPDGELAAMRTQKEGGIAELEGVLGGFKDKSFSLQAASGECECKIVVSHDLCYAYEFGEHHKFMARFFRVNRAEDGFKLEPLFFIESKRHVLLGLDELVNVDTRKVTQDGHAQTVLSMRLAANPIHQLRALRALLDKMAKGEAVDDDDLREAYDNLAKQYQVKGVGDALRPRFSEFRGSVTERSFDWSALRSAPAATGRNLVHPGKPAVGVKSGESAAADNDWLLDDLLASLQASTDASQGGTTGLGHDEAAIESVVDAAAATDAALAQAAHHPGLKAPAPSLADLHAAPSPSAGMEGATDPSSASAASSEGDVAKRRVPREQELFQPRGQGAALPAGQLFPTDFRKNLSDKKLQGILLDSLKQRYPSLTFVYSQLKKMSREKIAELIKDIAATDQDALQHGKVHLSQVLRELAWIRSDNTIEPKVAQAFKIKIDLVIGQPSGFEHRAGTGAGAGGR